MTRARFYSTTAAVAALVLACAGIGRKVLSGLPPFYVLEEYTPSQTTRVYDVHEQLMAEFSIEKRALLTLAQIPVDLQNAVIATEDSRFFEHCGVSPRAILRAALKNFIHRRVVEGASTLTQQLAKLIFLSPERKLMRKLREVCLALQLERNLSKEEILQFYLNQIYFGHGAYGVQAAARIYFGKDVKELTLAECALLAGLVKFPGGYSPFNRPKQAEARRHVVLKRMVEEKFITPHEMEIALKDPIPGQRPALSGVQAPYFVEYVRRHLEPKYGYSALWRGGLKIHTTLDLGAQKIVDEEMEKALSDFDVQASSDWAKQLALDQEAEIDPPTVSTSPPANIQGVFLLMDVKTGAIRAMTGGRGDQFNRAVQAQRQPGSTFKPFVWATAINAGLTGATLIEDSPLAYYYNGRDWRLLDGTTEQFSLDLATAPFAASENLKVWVPTNFDGKFLGVITLRKALALSRNVSSVRLIEHIGPAKVAELASHAGIHSRLEPVLSLGLGSSVVNPLELANAFQTFANGGIHVEPFSVTRVEDSRGRVLEQHAPKEDEALSPQTAFLITHLLKAVVESGTAVRANVLGRPLAGKTGTTNENKDLWFVGYTPDLVAAAWMGYDDFSSLGRKDLTGGSTVVPWWTKIMARILKDYPARNFPTPEDIVFLKIDAESGLLAGPSCPRQILQPFLTSAAPTQVCAQDHTRPLVLHSAFSPAPSASEPGTSVVEPGSLLDPALSGSVPAGTDPQPSLPGEEDLDRISQ